MLTARDPDLIHAHRRRRPRPGRLRRQDRAGPEHPRVPDAGGPGPDLRGQGGTIAGADFSLNADGSQTVTLNSLNPGSYRIIVQSAAAAQGTLTVKTYQGNAEISSGSVPVSIAAHETMTLTVPASSVSASQPLTLGTPVTGTSYDFSGDGVIDNGDVALVVRHWNSCRNQQKYDPFFDLNDDGCITVADVMKVLNAKTVK